MTNSTLLIDELQKQFPQNSKSSLLKWLKHGRILVDDQVAKRGSLELKSEQKVTLTQRVYKRHPFEVLFEDSDLIVIVKPYGILTVDSLDPSEKSLHSVLKDAYRPDRIFPVHRLDKDVSGPIIFAKSKRAFQALKEAFYDRDIKRVYLALVHNTPEEKRGVWESYLLEGNNYYVKASDSEGKHAITYYKVIDTHNDCSLLELTLETGRKNQLRVHAKEANCPIFGDNKYGILDNFDHLSLLAYKLKFTHPFTKEELSFKVEPPAFFKNYLRVTHLIFNKES